MAENLPRWNLNEVNFVETDSDAIKSEIICKYESVAGRTLAKADPIRIFLLAIADQIIHQRTLINFAAQNNLLSYAKGEYLDALGNYLQVTRLPASAATTTIKFTLSQALAENYSIPQNTLVTNGIVTFKTNQELIILAGNTTGSVAATCTTTGDDGNGYLAGQVATIVSPMAFVESATNTSETTGGSVEEDDESYAERIRLAPNSFSVAGSRKAYEFHTYSVSSAIKDVSVVTNINNPGYVYIYPLMTNGALPSQEVIAAIENYLSGEDIRPLTDCVVVQSPTAVNYTINVRYYIRNEDKVRGESIKAAVTAAVEEYRLWQQGKIGRDILPSKLIQMVMNAGASRVESDFAPSTRTQLNGTQVAQCSTANVNVAFVNYEEG